MLATVLICRNMCCTHTLEAVLLSKCLDTRCSIQLAGKTMSQSAWVGGGHKLEMEDGSMVNSSLI